MIFARRENARREEDGPASLAVAVAVGALLPVLPACGCGACDLAAAPRPEGSRSSGRGSRPPRSGAVPRRPARLWQGSSRQLTLPLGGLRVLRPNRPGPDGLARRRRALEAVEIVVTGKERYAGLDIGGTADRRACPRRRTVELVAWPVVTEDPWQPEGLVSWLPPDLLAARRAAIDLEMAAAGCLSGRAVAWLPADAHRAWSPRVMTAALLGEVQGLRSALFHKLIQT